MCISCSWDDTCQLLVEPCPGRLQSPRDDKHALKMCGWCCLHDSFHATVFGFLFGDRNPHKIGTQKGRPPTVGGRGFRAGFFFRNRFPKRGPQQPSESGLVVRTRALESGTEARPSGWCHRPTGPFTSRPVCAWIVVSLMYSRVFWADNVYMKRSADIVHLSHVRTFGSTFGLFMSRPLCFACDGSEHADHQRFELRGE